MSTTGEAMLNALAATLAAGVEAATVKRNVDVPSRIVGRMIIIRDGRQQKEDYLGTDGPWYVSHRPEIEMFVQVDAPAGSDAQAVRDAAFASLAADVDAALRADLTLGGLVFGMDWDDPEIDTERFPGAAGVKAAVLEPTVEYQSDTRL